MMTTYVAQAAPDFVSIILKNLPLIIFIAAAVLPSIFKSKAKQEKRRRQLERLEEGMSGTDRAMSSSNSDDLPSRVKGYFEEMAQHAREQARATPPPPVTRPPPPPVKRYPQSVPQGAPARPGAHAGPEIADMIDASATDLTHRYMVTRRTAKQSQKTVTTAIRTFRRRTLREAIVTREILGPCKAME